MQTDKIVLSGPEKRAVFASFCTLRENVNAFSCVCRHDVMIDAALP